MDNNKDSFTEDISSMKKELESYMQNKIDLTKLHVAEDLSRFFSNFTIKMILFYFAFFVLLFISMAVAFTIGRYTHNNEFGFIVVACIYLLFAIVFYLLRKKLIHKPFIKVFIHLFFPNYKDYDKK